MFYLLRATNPKKLRLLLHFGATETQFYYGCCDTGNDMGLDPRQKVMTAISGVLLYRMARLVFPRPDVI